MEIVVMVVAGLFIGVPVLHTAWVLHYVCTRAKIDQRLKDYVSR